MAQYPLAALLTLRAERLNKATQNVVQRTTQVRLAQNQVKNAQSKFEEYLKWRVEEINRRYQELMGQVKSQQELSEFNSGIGAIYAQEAVLEQELSQAQAGLKAAQEALSEAKTALKAAHKAHEKLLKHQEIWQIKERALAEYRADLELEDFTGKGRTSYQDSDFA